jgi:transcriptional regulator with XRE-family HTH domain
MWHRFAPVGFVCYIANMSTIVDDLDSRLGARLKIERERRGWSLTDLAERSGVSRAMINKVERGAASPTAALLGRLSGAFGLTLSALLARTEMSGAGRLARADDQLRWTDPATGYIRRQVAPAPGSDLPLDLVQVELPAGAAVSFPAAAYAFGRQLVWVLGGTLTFIEGDATHTLAAGDCLELGPPSDCTFRNDKKRPCRYAVVILRQAQ